MKNLRLAYLLLASTFICFAGCADSVATTPPDMPPAQVPIDPSGRFTATSSFALASPPPQAAGVLGELVAATDGPDDPSRYLIDLMIAKLPDGATKTYATAVAPYLAAYVNERLAHVAPRFANDARALALGLSRIAQRFGTTEVFELAADSGADDGRVGSLRRTITGYRFDVHGGHVVAEVRFAPLGLADLTAKTRMTLDGDTLTFDRHSIAVRYAQLLRLGFDFAVVPDVVPGAHDLAQALVTLVDCDVLGTVVSEWMGLGSPSFYATACRLGLSALATRIYDQIAAIGPMTLPLDVGGSAWAIDEEGDGPMDRIEMGTWTGSFAGIGVTSSFEGRRP